MTRITDPDAKIRARSRRHKHEQFTNPDDGMARIYADPKCDRGVAESLVEDIAELDTEEIIEFIIEIIRGVREVSRQSGRRQAFKEIRETIVRLQRTAQ